MIYTAWGLVDEGLPIALCEGEGPPRFVDGTPDPDCEKLYWRIEADSCDEAMQKYYDLHGWGEYVPMKDCHTKRKNKPE